MKKFSFNVLNSDGGEIRAFCFNNVVDQFYDQIEMGGIYLISKGSLRPVPKSFNHLNNEYEIMLESTSTIQHCSEDGNNIPKQQFSFRAISEIESLENSTMVDLIGIVTWTNSAGSIIKKKTQKQTLQFKDMSRKSVEINLCGNFCNTKDQKIQEAYQSGELQELLEKVICS